MRSGNGQLFRLAGLSGTILIKMVKDEGVIVLSSFKSFEAGLLCGVMSVFLGQGEDTQAGTIRLLGMVFGAEDTLEEFGNVGPYTLRAPHKKVFTPFADKTMG